MSTQSVQVCTMVAGDYHDMDDASVRIGRLEDVVQAVKRWREAGLMEISNGTVNWKDFEVVPKPVSKPPLMIGGGSPRVVRLAGREADIVSLNFNNRMGVTGPDGVNSICEELERCREAFGMTYVTVPMDAAEAFAPVVARLA